MPQNNEHDDWIDWRKTIDKVLQELITNQPEEKRTEAMQALLAKKVQQVHGAISPAPEKALLQNALRERDAACTERDVMKQYLLQAQKDTQHIYDFQKTAKMQLQHCETKLQKAHEELETLRAGVCCDHKPSQVEKELEGLSLPLRQLAERYYDLTLVHIFFVQCGQFNRLSQFWEACKRHVLEEEIVPPDMPHFLQSLLGYYNAATVQSEAPLLLPEAGTVFDFDLQQRVGQDGNKIRHVLLPGLKNPGGKVLHKALVVLDR